MSRIRWLVSLLFLGLLAGCGTSPPSDYYVLTPRGDGLPEAQQPAVGIAPVSVAGYLDRNRLITGSSGNRLEIAATQRWAEPLAQGVQRVLQLNLARLLGSGNVQAYPWSGQRPDVVVSVNIIALDIVGERARLIAEWRVAPPGEEQPRQRLSELDIPLDGNVARANTQVAAYSELLYRLSEQIAGEIR